MGRFADLFSSIPAATADRYAELSDKLDTGRATDAEHDEHATMAQTLPLQALHEIRRTRGCY